MLSTRRDLLPHGHRRRAREAAGPRAAVSPRAGAGHADAAVRQARGGGVPLVRGDARRERVGRAGPFRGAAGRHAGGRQGAAAEHRAGDREGHLAPAHGRPAAGEAVVRRQAPATAGGRRRVREDAARRARSHARGGELLAAAPQFRAFAAPARAGGALGLLRHRSDGDGTDDAASRSGRWTACARRGSTSRGSPAPASRCSSRRSSATPISMPTCTPATSSSPRMPPNHGKYIAARFRDHGHAVRTRPGLPRAELPRVLPPRLPSRGDRAPGVGLGAGRHPGGRARGGNPRRAGARVRPAALGDLPRRASCCSSSARRAASTSRSSRSSCSCRRRCSTSRASAGSSIPTSTCG